MHPRWRHQAAWAPSLLSPTGAGLPWRRQGRPHRAVSQTRLPAVLWPHISCPGPPRKGAWSEDRFEGGDGRGPKRLTPTRTLARVHIHTSVRALPPGPRLPGQCRKPRARPPGGREKLGCVQNGPQTLGHVQGALGSGEEQGGVWASPPAGQTLPPPIHPRPGKTRVLVSGQERSEEGGWGEAMDGGRPQPGAVAARGLCSGHGPLQWPSIRGAGVGPWPGLPGVGVQGTEGCGPPGPGHWYLQLLCWARPWRPRGPGGEGCRAGEGCWLALPSFPLGPKAPGAAGTKGGLCLVLGLLPARPLPLQGPMGDACVWSQARLLRPSCEGSASGRPRAPATAREPGSLSRAQLARHPPCRPP